MDPQELLRLTQATRDHWGRVWHFAIVSAIFLAVGEMRRRWNAGGQRKAAPAPQPKAGKAAEMPWRRDNTGPEASLAMLAQFGVPELLAVRPLETVVALLDTILAGAADAYVLFRHGTFVLVGGPEGSEVETALARLADFGFVDPGGPAGDFSTGTITHARGWAVSGHGEGMMTFVAPEELGGEMRSELEVGLIGRAKRHLDAGERQVVHVGRLRGGVGS